MGNVLLEVLIAEYIVILLVYAWNGDWAKALYFLGAVLLSFGILWS